MDRPIVAVQLELKNPTDADVKRIADGIARQLENSLRTLGKGIFKSVIEELKQVEQQGKATGEGVGKGATKAATSFEKAARSGAKFAETTQAAFVSALSGADSAEKLALSLLSVGANGGASTDALMSIATATGAFSEDTVKLAVAVAQEESAFVSLVKAYGEGKASLSELQSQATRLMTANAQLAESQKRATTETRQQAQAAKEATAAQAAYDKVVSSAIVSALRGAQGVEQLTLEMLRQVGVVGQSTVALESIARETGLFSDEEIRLASALAQAKAEFSATTEAYRKGEASLDDLQSAARRTIEINEELSVTQRTQAGNVREQAEALARLTASLLPVNNAAQQHAKTMAEQAAKAGATADAVLDLARQTDAFSHEQLEAVEEAARLTQSLERQAKTFAGNSRDAENLAGDLGRLATLSQRLGVQTQKTGHSFISLGSFARQASRILGALGIYGVTEQLLNLGKESLRTAVEFEAAFYRVAKTVEGVADAMGRLTLFGEKLRSQLTRISETSPVSPEEVYRIGELAGQLGIVNTELVDFVDLVSRINVTTNLEDVEEASLQLARFQNILQLTQDDLRRWASSVVELGNRTASTEEEIIRFSRRIAGAGAAIQLTAADIAGISAAFISAGVEIEAGGTAVQRFMLAINNAVLEGGSKLAQFGALLGQTAEEFTAAFRADPGEQFVKIVEAIAATGTNASSVIAELVTADVRLQRAFLSIAAAGDLLRESVDISNQAFEENIALTRESELQYGTTKSAVEKLSNSWKIFLSNLADTETIKGAANALNDLFSSINARNDRMAVSGAAINDIFAALAPGFDISLADLVSVTGAVDGVLVATDELSDAQQKIFDQVKAINDAARNREANSVTDLTISQRQVDRLTEAVKLLEVLGGSVLPKTQDEWLALFHEIERTAGGVDGYIASQLLLNAGMSTSSGVLALLSTDLQNGRFSYDQLKEGLSLLIAAQGDYNSVVDPSVELAREHRAEQAALYEELLKQLGLWKEEESAVSAHARAVDELRISLIAVSESAMPAVTQAVEKLIAAQEEYISSTGDGVVPALEELHTASSDLDNTFNDLFFSLLRAAGESETFAGSALVAEDGIIALQVALGLLSEQGASSVLSARRLNAEITELAVQLVGNEVSAERAAIAYQALLLGVVSTADAALIFSENEEVATRILANKTEALEAGTQAQLAAASATQVYRNAVVEQINALLQVTDEQDAYLVGLVSAGIEAGLSAAKILELVRATGLFSESQLVAAENAALYQRRQHEVITEVSRGNITMADAVTILRAYAQQLGIVIEATSGFSRAHRDAFGTGFIGALRDAAAALGEGGGTTGGGVTSSMRAAGEEAKEFMSALDSVRGEAESGEVAIDDYGESLLEMAGELGVSVDQLVALGLATGALTEEEAKATLGRLATIKGLQAIASAYAAGEISADQAAAAAVYLQEQVAAGAEIDLSPFNVEMDRARQAVESVGTAASTTKEDVVNWVNELLTAAQTAGASNRDLVTIAESTGLYSQEAINAAVAAGVLAAAVSFLSDNISSISSLGAVEQLERLEESVMNAQESLSPQAFAGAIDAAFNAGLDPERIAAVLQGVMNGLEIPLAVDVVAAATPQEIAAYFQQIIGGIPPALAFVDLKAKVDKRSLEAASGEVSQATGKATMQLDTTEADSSLEEVVEAIEEAEPQMIITADNEEALAAVYEVEDEAAESAPIITIYVDDEAARNQVQDFITWVNSQTFTIGGNADTGGGSGGGTDGGDAFAAGGLVTGPAGTDRVRARLTSGEYVLPVAAVQTLGVPLLDAVRAGDVAGLIDQVLNYVVAPIGVAQQTTYDHSDRRQVVYNNTIINHYGGGGRYGPTDPPSMHRRR